MNETAERIAVRFVARTALGQMRNPFYWLFRVTKRFKMHEGEQIDLVIARIAYYVDLAMNREDAIRNALAERPEVLH